MAQIITGQEVAQRVREIIKNEAEVFLQKITWKTILKNVKGYLMSPNSL